MRSLRALTIALACVLTACVSHADPRTDYYHPLRGGYVDFEIQPGLYRIEAKSDRALTGVSEAAKHRWNERALELCGASAFQELAVRESFYEIRRTGDVVARVLPLPQSKIATRTGYALCNAAKLSQQEAFLAITQKGWPVEVTAAGRDPQRISVSGISVAPPPEPNWERLQLSTFQVAFGKRGPQPDATYIAVVMLYTLPDLTSEAEFLKHVSAGRKAEPDVGRFKTVRNEENIARAKGALCVRYDTISEDHAARTTSGDKRFMLSNMIGYHCQHPKRRTVGVNFQYSHRHQPGHEDPLFATKGAAFLEQIEFTDF